MKTIYSPAHALHSLLLVAFLALLVACQPISAPAPAGDAPPTPTAAQEDAATAAPLVGTVWQWQETAMNDGSRSEPDDPARYTLEFLPNGTIAVLADCNSGSGSYTLDGAQLTIGQIAITLMACPAGTFSDVYLQQLAEVSSYLMDGENLVLELRFDSGGMIFAPATAGDVVEAAPMDILL